MAEAEPKNVVLFGLSLAGALLSKFTAGVLFAAFVAFALSLRWRAVPGQPGSKTELRQWRRARRWATLKGVSCAALAVYAFYFVFSWHQPTSALVRFGTGPAALLLRRLLMPPLLYLGGVLWVVLSGRRGTFVLGHAYPHAVWFYFPVVFALKSSLGFLGLLLLAALTGISKKVRGERSIAVIPAQFALHWRVLWVSLLVFTGVCLLSPLDISIRHFSVPLVLLIMLLAPLPRMLGVLQGRSVVFAGAATVVALAVSCLFNAVHAYPYYFPYINALSLGRPNYALVNDSNVDWNQGLPEVRRFAEQQDYRKLRWINTDFRMSQHSCRRRIPGIAKRQLRKMRDSGSRSLLPICSRRAIVLGSYSTRTWPWPAGAFMPCACPRRFQRPAAQAGHRCPAFIVHLAACRSRRAAFSRI